MIEYNVILVANVLIGINYFMILKLVTDAGNLNLF